MDKLIATTATTRKPYHSFLLQPVLPGSKATAGERIPIFTGPARVSSLSDLGIGDDQATALVLGDGRISKQDPNRQITITRNLKNADFRPTQDEILPGDEISLPGNRRFRVVVKGVDDFVRLRRLCQSTVY